MDTHAVIVKKFPNLFILLILILGLVACGAPEGGGSGSEIDDSGPGGSTTPPPTLDEFDLSRYSIHFSVAAPIPPTILSTINVPADMSFQAATGISGSRIVVADGYSGAGRTSGWGNDIEIVMSNTASVTAVNFQNAQRISWTGGNVTGGMNANGFRDILINNVHVTGDTASNWSTGQQPFQRLALINSTFEGIDSPGVSSWGIFVRPVVNYTSGPRHRDMIVANVITRSTGYQAARFSSVDNLVVVDSVGLNSGFPQSGWRVHYNSRNVYFENTIGRGVFLTLQLSTDTGPQVTNAVFRNHHQYQDDAASQSFFVHVGAPNTGNVFDSTMHWTGGAGSVAGISPFVDSGGNSRVAWNGSTIDFSQMPGKSSLSDYGANH